MKIVEVSLEFNFENFEFLELDMGHVNRDGRSNYTAREITLLVKGLIEGLRLSPSGIKEFGDDLCSYFVRTGMIKMKKYKMVFCICSDKPNTIGVITLHRI